MPSELLEVSARFTLDAMRQTNGHDADLNSGLISEGEARERRVKIQREAVSWRNGWSK